MNGLYATSVLGTAAAALAIYVCSGRWAMRCRRSPLYGCFGGIFGMLVAIGTLYGDMEFLLFFAIGIKARYMAVIYGADRRGHAVWAAANVRLCATGRRAGRLALCAHGAAQGISFMLSERWYGLRNGYYRWKRRRAARKFEVYMRKQGRTVRFDGNGRLIDEDPGRQEALELKTVASEQRSMVRIDPLRGIRAFRLRLAAQ